MSTARKILWNTAAQVLGRLITGVFGILTVKLLTTYLGLPGYGFYKSVYEFMTFFAIVADLGLYTIGVREMSKHPEDEEKILGNIMTIRTFLIIMMTIIAFLTAFTVPEFQGTFAPFAVATTGTATIFSILTGTVSSILQVHLKMEYNSIASVIGRVISLSYLFITAYLLFPKSCNYELPQNLIGEIASDQLLKSSCHIFDAVYFNLFLAGVLGNLAMLIVTAYFTRKYIKISYRFDFKFWRDVILKALPYGIALVLNTVYFRIGSILLLLLKGKEFVAIYGVPLTMLEAAGIIPLYFMNSILPVISRSIQQKNGKEQSIIQFSFDFLMISSFPLVAGAFVLAYELILLISTDKFISRPTEGFYGSDVVFQILIFALLFSFINSLFGYIIVAINRQEKLLIRNLIGAALTVLISLIIIPIFDVRGAAFANIITEAYIATASYLIAKKYLKFKLSLKTTFKALVSAIAMSLTVYFLREPTYHFLNLQNKNFLILIPIGAFVYISLLFLTKALTPQMINQILKRTPTPTPTPENPNQST